MSDAATKPKVVKSDAEWRKELTAEQFRVTRQHGTERAHTHPYNAEKRDGIYHCVCCGQKLFASEAKYNSGTGWPSFFQPVSEGAVDEHDDRSFFSRRTEIRCSSCDAHLGHVFPDGPQPTGQRYCMNGAALLFNPDDKKTG